VRPLRDACASRVRDEGRRWLVSRRAAFQVPRDRDEGDDGLPTYARRSCNARSGQGDDGLPALVRRTLGMRCGGGRPALARFERTARLGRVATTVGLPLRAATALRVARRLRARRGRPLCGRRAAGARQALRGRTRLIRATRRSGARSSCGGALGPATVPFAHLFPSWALSMHYVVGLRLLL
jgi:hypothetical protein